MSLSQSFVRRSSSALDRSLPQPAQIVSLPVPPTIQSLPRSPKIASSPSVLTVAISAQPWFVGCTQPSAVVRPSRVSKFRKYWYAVGAGPPRSVQLPLLDDARHDQTLPFALKRIARRGSYSS